MDDSHTREGQGKQQQTERHGDRPHMCDMVRKELIERQSDIIASYLVKSSETL